VIWLQIYQHRIFESSSISRITN